ncbi:hypothetical protein [Ottowia sp.]|uniref:hypothetical protein n=1 Tax=Ottowia sp. TaxID=1898956 RepID=UPI00260CCB25|nr:hypothetical protein [Ottowia sp.]
MTPTQPVADEVAAEHAALLRHWAGVQARVSRQACEQAGRCAALEAEVLRWRARWIVATTGLLWGLGWPGLGPAALATAAVRTEDDSPRDAAELICQTGCSGHAHAWRDEEGQCRLSGADCTRVPPVAQAPVSSGGSGGTVRRG